jgi:hypothetical protein
MASDHPRNVGPMQSAPRCERIKRDGACCRAPAVTGRKLCRAHGGKAGAPKGNHNALKRGAFTMESLEQDRTARAWLKRVDEALEETSTA